MVVGMTLGTRGNIRQEMSTNTCFGGQEIEPGYGTPSPTFVRGQFCSIGTFGKDRRVQQRSLALGPLTRRETKHEVYDDCDWLRWLARGDHGDKVMGGILSKATQRIVCQACQNRVNTWK